LYSEVFLNDLGTNFYLSEWPWDQLLSFWMTLGPTFIFLNDLGTNFCILNRQVFSLDRILFYSGFGLDRWHCIYRKVLIIQSS
jgi:hypothetical protein